MPFHIETQCCHVSAYVESAADPDTAVACDNSTDACCADEHHHGQAANETGTPCRPIKITMMPGSVTMKLSGS